MPLVIWFHLLYNSPMKTRKFRNRRRKILFFLIIGSVVLFIALMVEFFLFRYNANRSVVFRSESNIIQIYKDRKWQDFTVNGMTVSGPDVSRDEYTRILKTLAGLEVNLIKVNTIMQPDFYQAFFEYNMLTKKPLYMLHGIYINNDLLRQFKNAYDEPLINAFFEGIRRTVDVVHGNAVIRTGGGVSTITYNLNIAPYVAGYFFSSDINTDFVVSTNDRNNHVLGFEGDYLYTENASPYEAWLAGMSNYVVSYEQENYRGPTRLMGWNNRQAGLSGQGGSFGDDWILNFSHVQITEKYIAGFFTSLENYPGL